MMNGILSRVASLLPFRIVAALTGMVLLTPHQQAQAPSTPALGTEAPFTITSQGGSLDVLKLGSAFTPTFQVKWNGKSLSTFENDRTVRLLNRAGRDRSILLLDFQSQGEDCPTHYRVIDLGVHSQPFLSPDIGDCSLPRKVEAIPAGLRVTFRGWKYPQRTVAPATWTYTVTVASNPGSLVQTPVGAPNGGAQKKISR